ARHADDRDELVSVDRHGDVVDGGKAVEACADALELDHRALPPDAGGEASSIRTSRITAAEKANSTVGSAPSRTRSAAIWPRPWKTSTPKAPPPISAAMGARPMLSTRTVR